MKVKILKTEENRLAGARILGSQVSGLTLPSVMDGWRFDFKRHSKKKGFQTYVLVSDESPEIIEGCLIFQMRGSSEPFMSFMELAPHNIGAKRKYERIAGCLIAFACRLSFKYGKGDFLGWLAFEVLEEKKEDEVKLMTLYCTKYYALRFDSTTTMVIPPEGGEKMILEFLN